MKQTQPLIEAKDLGFAYADQPVLEHVTFTITSGEYVGIVGPNGGGKTTLLKLLVGLLTPTTGSLRIQGVAPTDTVAQSQIGYVPQRVSQDQVGFPATVKEVVESGRTILKGWFEPFNEKDHLAVAEALKIAGITDLQQRLMSTLSGGQRQRVYVARALASQPKLLILDEPFVGVDVHAQAEFYTFLKNLNTQHGLTILLVSHDIDAITEEVKSILCLNRGLLCSGSPSLLHQAHVMDHVYGKKITHIHRHD